MTTANPDVHPPLQLSDLEIARAYATGTGGRQHIHDWIGTPLAAEPVPGDELHQAAADTVDYLQSRPAGPEDVIPSYIQYLESLAQEPTLQQKSAQALVDDWVEADFLNDKTKAHDVEAELTRRALPRDYERSRSTVAAAEAAAYLLHAAHNRKERLKRHHQAQDLAQLAARPMPAAPQAEERRDSLPIIAPPVRPAIEEQPADRPGLADELLGEQPPAEHYVRPVEAVAVREVPPATLRARILAYYKDPERGRRRQILTAVALAGLGALACVLCTIGASEVDVNDRDGIGVSPGIVTTSTATVHVSPSGSEITPPTPTPSLPEPTLIPPTSTELLVPTAGYRYVWGAFASVFGADAATGEILERVGVLRQQGWDVDLWGDVRGRTWGIACIETPSGKQITDVSGQIEALNYAAVLQSGTASVPDPANLVDPAWGAAPAALVEPTTLPPAVTTFSMTDTVKQMVAPQMQAAAYSLMLLSNWQFWRKKKSAR